MQQRLAGLRHACRAVQVHEIIEGSVEELAEGGKTLGRDAPHVEFVRAVGGTSDANNPSGPRLVDLEGRAALNQGLTKRRLFHYGVVERLRHGRRDRLDEGCKNGQFLRSRHSSSKGLTIQQTLAPERRVGPRQACQRARSHSLWDRSERRRGLTRYREHAID